MGAGLVQHIFPGKIFLDAGILHRNMILMCLHDSGSSLLASLSAITEDEVLHWVEKYVRHIPTNSECSRSPPRPPDAKIAHTDNLCTPAGERVLLHLHVFMFCQWVGSVPASAWILRLFRLEQGP